MHSPNETTDVITDTSHIGSISVEEVLLAEATDVETESTDDLSTLSKVGHVAAVPFVAVGRFFGRVGSNIHSRAQAANDIALARRQMKVVMRQQLREAGRAIRSHRGS